MKCVPQAMASDKILNMYHMPICTEHDTTQIFFTFFSYEILKNPAVQLSEIYDIDNTILALNINTMGQVQNYTILLHL